MTREKKAFPLFLAASLLLASVLLTAGQASAQDVKRGEKLFTDCRACHAIDPGAPNVHNVGPSLAGIIGRKAATVDGYRFSPAMKRSNITWDKDTLAAFIADPQKVVPANRMPYAGMPDVTDVSDLIAYLAQAGGSAK
jgi:cytochrome c